MASDKVSASLRAFFGPQIPVQSSENAVMVISAPNSDPPPVDELDAYINFDATGNDNDMNEVDEGSLFEVGFLFASGMTGVYTKNLQPRKFTIFNQSRKNIWIQNSLRFWKPMAFITLRRPRAARQSLQLLETVGHIPLNSNVFFFLIKKRSLQYYYMSRELDYKWQK